MKSTKIFTLLAFLVFCCITYTYSLKCYQCQNPNDCKKPTLLDCSSFLANQTRTYLDFHHKGVNMTLTSPYIECFTEKIKSVNGEFSYKGCIYQTTRGCLLELKDIHAGGKIDRKCNQCNNKNGCNPAGRIEANLLTVSTTIALLAVAKLLTRS